MVKDLILTDTDSLSEQIPGFFWRNFNEKKDKYIIKDQAILI